MKTSDQWQLAQDAAERYQTILTPNILGPFAQALVDFAALQPGEHVVDVGCGTGAAARFAAPVVGPSGQVAGVDVNASMIDVARSLPDVPGAPITWHVASATELPVPDAQVDAVVCAQTLQFLPQKLPSLAEMKRVVKQNGRITISLWTPIEDNPYFHTLVEAMAEHVGAETAVGLGAAFALSDGPEIQKLLAEAGFNQVEMQTVELDLPLPSLREFVPRHVQATPMANGFNRASAAQQQAVVETVAEKLQLYEANGRTQIPFRSHMICCRK
ncbi:MAG: methyltransferase domain-containing protein [Ardenticatenaceae bacterium]|nr:methyltransferase domain-containing protein [Ardenticatenaceae bacterium]